MRPRAILVVTRLLLAGAVACGAACRSSKKSTTRARTAEVAAAPRAAPMGPGAGAGTAAAVKPPDGGNDYIISPSDVIEIAVFQEPDLKSTLRVSNEGTIAFPLVGVVQVGGLTPRGAANVLRDRLAQGGFLINPQVTLTVMEFSKRRFTVLGEVQKPGSYEMPAQQEVTVLQAIGIAGGYTRLANPSKVTLMRKIEGQQRTFELNAKRMASGNAESAFMIQPGDVITVAERRI